MEFASLDDIEAPDTVASGATPQEPESPILRLSVVASWILMLINFTMGAPLIYRVMLRLIFIYPTHPPTWYNAGYQILDVVIGGTFIAMGLDIFLQKAILRRHPKMVAVIAMAFSGVNTLYIYHRYGDVLEAGLATLNFADGARALILVSGLYLGARVLRGEPVVKRSTFALISLILLVDSANYIFFFRLPYTLLIQPEAFGQTRMLIQAVQFIVIVAAGVYSTKLALGRLSETPGVLTLPWYVKGGIFLFGIHFVLWGLQEGLVNTEPLVKSLALHPAFALAPIILTLKGATISLAAFYPWKIPVGEL